MSREEKGDGKFETAQVYGLQFLTHDDEVLADMMPSAYRRQWIMENAKPNIKTIKLDEGEIITAIHVNEYLNHKDLPVLYGLSFSLIKEEYK